MEKTYPMELVEKVTGQRLEDLIAAAVEKHGGVEKAAELEFGITPAGLRKWIAILGGEVATSRTVVFPVSERATPAPDVQLAGTAR